MKRTQKTCRLLVSAMAGMLMIPGNVMTTRAAEDIPGKILYTEESKKYEEEFIEQYAIVTADVLNVREGQGTEYWILTQILQDQVYRITGEAVNGWYPVQVEELSGWVCGEYITVREVVLDPESKEDSIAAEKVAGKSGAAEETAQEQQETLAMTSSSIFVENAGQAVIEYACQFIGNPYVWGGTSLTEGADCSGFVQSVYANFGIYLPRTTWEMENAGYAVSYEEALPGDLVLYDGHVGLYMGDGTIVNAMNEVDGIGICSATYAPIVTVRRVL